MLSKKKHGSFEMGKKCVEKNETEEGKRGREEQQ